MKRLMGQLSSHGNGSLWSTDAWRIPQMGQSTGNRLEDGLRCNAGLTGLAAPFLKPRMQWKHCQEFAWNMGALLRLGRPG
jgi:hypothetical protein